MLPILRVPNHIKLRLGKDGYKIINIVVNGVNLGLTFRNQFKALANKNDENIDAISLSGSLMQIFTKYE
ncbi:MAG: hypothetical protein CM15mP104_0160 [Gammaproteobacteria bacterium]|nr:MAG: hypothetical protein CM15mP104_0160 [Gammaproteobacteria bacterium]